MRSGDAAQDRRAFGRRTTRCHAWIEAAGRARIACVVQNVSVAGAMIELSEPTRLPFRVTLHVEATGFIGRGEVRYQNGNHVGLRFE